MSAVVPPKRRSWKRPLQGLLVVLLVLPVGAWCSRPISAWRVRVLDKTVPHPDYREHSALMWALNHWRAPSPSGRSWRPATDYIGYHPQIGGRARPGGDALDASGLSQANALFITDTYGVYAADEAAGAPNQTGLDYSKRLYGGLSSDEAGVIEQFVKRGGALIGEFNTFASPTDGVTRARMEALFGLKWTDWSGRYFEDLADVGDVPVWARRNWLAHHGVAWAFQGPGYLFVNEDSRIEVLREGPDVPVRGLRLRVESPGDPLLRDCRDDVPFRYWFDIVQPLPTTEVLSRYQLDPTPAGSKLLSDAGIPSSFPAVLRSSRSPVRIYFAGDFSDNEIVRGPYWYSAWPWLRRQVGFDETVPDQGAFFWDVFAPMVGNLLSTPPSQSRGDETETIGAPTH